jgi:hypothetical protein
MSNKPLLPVTREELYDALVSPADKLNPEATFSDCMGVAADGLMDLLRARCLVVTDEELGRAAHRVYEQYNRDADVLFVVPPTASELGKAIREKLRKGE